MIRFCLTLKVVFGLALRQTVGFATSLLKFLGMNVPVPDFGTLCRRQNKLAVVGLTGKRLAFPPLTRSGLEVPGRQFVDPVDLVVGDAGEDVGQPDLRIDAIELGGLDQGVGDRGGFAAAF